MAGDASTVSSDSTSTSTGMTTASHQPTPTATNSHTSGASGASASSVQPGAFGAAPTLLTVRQGGPLADDDAVAVDGTIACAKCKRRHHASVEFYHCNACGSDHNAKGDAQWCCLLCGNLQSGLAHCLPSHVHVALFANASPEESGAWPHCCTNCYKVNTNSLTK